MVALYIFVVTLATYLAQISLARSQTNDSIWQPVAKNVWQQKICGVIDGFQEKLFNTCVWGKNCGGGCAPYQDNGIADPGDDELDAACLEHDMCLCKARSTDARRACDRELVRTASKLAEDLDKCGDLNKVNPFCWNDEIVCTAVNIAIAMDIVGSGDEINYSCVLHQGERDEYGYEDEQKMEKEKGAISPTADASSIDAAPEALEKFNFEMDWNPSSCYQDSSCSNTKTVRAFTINQMTSKLENRDQKNSRCWKADSPEAKSLDVREEVSTGTLRALECIFENSAGSNNDLWKEVYVRVGSCSGLSPKEYFDTMVNLYTNIGLNTIANEFGISKENNIIDRDRFLDFVSEKVGKKAWIECNPDTRILEVVLVCVNPSPPFNIIDCTMDRKDPTSSNGIPCRGDLMLPMDTGLQARDACIPYVYPNDTMSDMSDMSETYKVSSEMIQENASRSPSSAPSSSAVGVAATLLHTVGIAMGLMM